MKRNFLISRSLMALLFLFLSLPFCVGAQEQNQPGEILVKFKPDLSQNEIIAVVAQYGTAIMEYNAEIDVYRLTILSDSSITEVVNLFANDPRCEYAEPNAIGQRSEFFPNDTFFPRQWYLDNTGQTGGTPDADIDAVEGWQITRGSSAIVVAVLDTGIDSDHPEFQGRILRGYDYVNNDDDPEDDHSHGTYVSGIIAANADNNFSIAGIDHNVQILPVKVLDDRGDGTVFELSQGLIFAAEQGARVINMSLQNYPTDSTTLNDALQFARDAGAILIASAGNGGIGYADVSGPGASPLTISVGATDHNDARADFSGTGKALDLVAPGVDLPTVLFDSNEDNFTPFSGTSAAAPVVSGIATLLLSLDDSLTHNQVLIILAGTSEDLVGPADKDTKGRDDFFGYGRVNMKKALLLVGIPQIISQIFDIIPHGSPDGITP
jgi:subtilisin family serine protease